MYFFVALNYWLQKFKFQPFLRYCCTDLWLSIFIVNYLDMYRHIHSLLVSFLFQCAVFYSSLCTVKLFSCISRSIEPIFCFMIVLACLSFLSIIFMRYSLRYINPRVLSVESTSVMSRAIPPLPTVWRADCMSRNLAESLSVGVALWFMEIPWWFLPL